MLQKVISFLKNLLDKSDPVALNFDGNKNYATAKVGKGSTITVWSHCLSDEEIQEQYGVCN